MVLKSNEMIDSGEISVVIQGAFDNLITPKTINSIKKYLPKAEIILSTWEGTSVPENLSVDKILLNKDPGCYAYNNSPKAKKNNVNRQIVSTFNGLKSATRKYVLKIRTDFILTGNNFLNYFDKYKKVNPKYQLFEKRVLACSFFSRQPEILKMPFFMSDLIFFGLTKDVLKLFDIPLYPKEEEFVVEYQGFLWNRYAPEQYIFCSALKKNNLPFSLKNTWDLTEKNIEQTHNYFVNNFVFLSFGQYDIIPSDSIVKIDLCYSDCYTLFRWKNLYKKYVDSEFIIEEKSDSVFKNLAKIDKIHFALKVICLVGITVENRRKIKYWIMDHFKFLDKLFRKLLLNA